MKNLKKPLSLVLALLMLVSVFTLAPVTASAEISGKYEYAILEDGTAEIRGYSGKNTTLEIPSEICGYTVTNIGDWAFWNCTSLVNVIIGNGVTSIGNCAFKSCTSLESITIPDSVTSISGDAFFNTAWYNNQPDGAVYAGKVAYKYKGTCPAEVTVKDGTLGIGDYAFWDCTSLENITIPDSVISIGFCAFEDCTSLESITIPDSVTSIGGYAFENCTSLASVTIGNGVTNIGRNAFHNTAWYDNQPDGVVYAGKVAYKYKGTCPAEVTVKDGTLGISDNAFTSCTSLESITLPDSVKSIGDDAFYNCTSLASITIPSSVTSIGGYAFNKCTSLESVTIGNGVKSIGFGAFASCTSLTSISVDSDNKNYCSIDGNLYSKDQTTLIQYAIGKNYTSFAIPTGVTKIEDSAFYNCTSLKSITIPSSVTSIGGSAFDNCTSLESVTIPDSVISIGFCAFYDCTSLKSITIPSSVTSIVYNALGFYYDEDYGECKIDGFKITGYPNTEAERYANDNGFEFISLREVPTYITKISLSNTSLPIFIGKESSVKVTSFSPKSATDQTIKWSLSKSGYVQITKVNDAAKAIKFKGLKKGTVYIYARNGQGKLLGKVKVTVKQPVTKISTKTVTVSSKKSYKIKLSSYYKVLPTSADTRSVNILVNNSVRKYMSYKNGYLYVKKNAKKGTYTIRLDAKDGSGVKGYIKVKVK